MWKLLPVCLLAACSMHEQQPGTGDNSGSEPGRIVSQVDLVATPAEQGDADQPPRVSFQQQGIRGWLDRTGAWHIRREVAHNRLRCATYETGIRAGTGNPGCSDVEWLSDVGYATRMRHCNSATRLHEGDGRFDSSGDRLEGVTCVRVVVRCQGAC